MSSDSIRSMTRWTATIRNPPDRGGRWKSLRNDVRRRPRGLRNGVPYGHGRRLHAVHAFSGADGDWPRETLFQASTATSMGRRIRAARRARARLIVWAREDSKHCTTSHRARGTRPSGLVQAADGDLYGTTAGGSLQPGIIFRMDAAGDVSTDRTLPGGSPGNALILASDGNRYGTTQQSVFRLDPAGNIPSSTSFSSMKGSVIRARSSRGPMEISTARRAATGRRITDAFSVSIRREISRPCIDSSSLTRAPSPEGNWPRPATGRSTERRSGAARSMAARSIGSIRRRWSPSRTSARARDRPEAERKSPSRARTLTLPRLSSSVTSRRPVSPFRDRRRSLRPFPR